MNINEYLLENKSCIICKTFINIIFNFPERKTSDIELHLLNHKNNVLINMEMPELK